MQSNFRFKENMFFSALHRTLFAAFIFFSVYVYVNWLNTRIKEIIQNYKIRKYQYQSANTVIYNWVLSKESAKPELKCTARINSIELYRVANL